MEHPAVRQHARHRPLLGAAGSFGAGIFFNECAALPAGYLVLSAALLLLIALLSRKRNIVSSVFLFGAFIVLGALFSESRQTLPKEHIYHVAKYYRKSPVLIEGVIASDVQDRDFFKGKKTTFVLDVKRFKTRRRWKRKSGKVLVNLFREENLSYGDDVLIEGDA